MLAPSGQHFTYYLLTSEKENDMAIQTLYGFLVDDALRQTKKLDLSNSFDQGYGVLTGEPASYFVNKGRLGDARKNRLLLLNSRAAFGSVSIEFDQNRFDTDLLEDLTDIENALLFNIIERIYLHQEYSDSNIESQLTSSSNYRGYVPGSYAHSTVVGTAEVYDNSKVAKRISLYDWYAFEFQTETSHFNLHFWVSNRAFRQDYPYTTITRVIPPYDPAILADPVVLIQSGNLSVLESGSSFIFSKMNLEVASKDQNGIYTFPIKYVVDSTRTVALPFSLAYCGAKVPSSLECRKAIRDYLSENTQLSTAEMEILFPELFINSRFFVVPLWDLYTQLTDREVYNSIFKMSAIRARAQQVFEGADADFMEEHMEMLLQAQNKMALIALPDELNDSTFSILKEHPTYQDYSSQVPGWKYMTKDTQEFAGKLIRCIAVLNGESSSKEFIETNMDGRKYLGFSSGKAEYLVMTRETYEELIAF